MLSWIPSWQLTPQPKAPPEDDPSFPQVGNVSSLQGIRFTQYTRPSFQRNFDFFTGFLFA